MFLNKIPKFPTMTIYL